MLRPKVGAGWRGPTTEYKGLGRGHEWGGMVRPHEPKGASQGRRVRWQRRRRTVPYRYALMAAYWFAVAATVLFSVLYGWHSWQRYKKTGVDRLMLTTSLVAASVHMDLDREASGLRFLAQRLAATHALGHLARTRRLLRAYQKVSPEVASVELIAPSGQVLVSTAVPAGRPLPDFEKDPGLWPSLHRALQRPGLHIHRPMHGPLVGYWVIGFSDTITGPHGHVRFLLTAPIRFRHFEAVFMHLPLSSGLAVGILRNDDYMEARAPVPRTGLRALLAQRQTGILAQTWRRHPRAARGVFSGWVSADREYRYGVFVRITGYPLVAFADVPRALWVAQWWRRQAEIPLIFLIAALLFSGYAYRQVQALAVRWENEAARRAELLRNLVMHDPLTGLLNRKGLFTALRRAMARSERDGRLLAVGFLDIDDFKGVNDRYGHAAGDTVLKTLARRLEGSLRGTDHVARLGGDEFVLLIEGLRRKADLAPIVTQVKAALDAPISTGRAEIPVRASLGVAFYPLDALDADSLIARADRAMYAAKRRATDDREGWMRLYDPDLPAHPDPGPAARPPPKA